MLTTLCMAETTEPDRFPLSRMRRAASSVSDRVRQALTPDGFVPMRVLVVDDHQDGAESLAMVVELLWCPVQACHDGYNALAVAEHFDPQVCLLDLRIPGMDGLELALRLKARASDLKHLLVATTAFGDEESKARTAKAGFHDHLIKPVEDSTLIDTLTRLGEIL